MDNLDARHEIAAEGFGLAATRTPPEVVLVSTLHQFHPLVPCYQFGVLSDIVEALSPSVLAVELTPANLATRADTTGKPEYPAAIYPLLDRCSFDVVPLEPDEPLFSELIDSQKRAGACIADRDTGQGTAFNEFFLSLYRYLAATWNSPADVNSRETDALFRAKHAFQDSLFPELVDGWERWNEHFLTQIITAALQHPGSRIVGLVGAEHGYWLREKLATDRRIVLADTHDLLVALDLGHARLGS